MAVGPRNQQNSGAAAEGGFGEGVAHASAGTVGEIADRVDLFARGTGGDENRFAGKILRRAERFEDGGDDGVIFGEASGTGHAAGEVSVAGFDDAARRAHAGFQGSLASPGGSTC